VGQVITVMNMKGGVGKTTVTLNLAGMLSRASVGGKSALNVLMIDYDPQFNLSQAFLESKKYFGLEKARKTTLSILTDDPTALDPYKIQVPGNHNPPSVASLAAPIYKQFGKSGRLDIVPSTLDLMYVALGQATSNTAPIEERFAKFITEAKGIYDIVLIDCHPAGSLFTKTSLTNSDYVLIPVVPQKYAVRGIGLMMEFIKAKKTSTAVAEPIILFNATDRAGISVEESSIRANGRFAAYCLPTSLKKLKAFADAEEGRGFVWVSNKPYSKVAYSNLMNVAKDLRSRIKV
jgi:chromosome partitioning protein